MRRLYQNLQRACEVMYRPYPYDAYAPTGTHPENAAVKHGHAATIRIAGALENGQLLFSVSDDGEAALSLARKHHPDVILLDMKMPKKDGVAVTIAVKAEQPQTKILILTSFSDTEDISKALDAGAE